MRAPWRLDSARSAHRVGETKENRRFWEYAALSLQPGGSQKRTNLEKSRGWRTGSGNRIGEPAGGKKRPHVLVQKEGCLGLANLGEIAVHWSREPFAEEAMVLEDRRAEFWKQRNRFGM